jgi:hypothetical protein
MLHSSLQFVFGLYITVFPVFRLLPDFVCLYTYVFWLSLCKIVQSSVILFLRLFDSFTVATMTWLTVMEHLCVSQMTMDMFHLS